MHPHRQIHTYEAPSAGDPAAVVPVDDEPLKLQKRPPADGELDLTPMIDMTFLLLIFFLVSSKIAVQGDVHLPMAKHGRAVEMGKAVVITLTEAGTDGKANIFLGNSTDPANRCKSTEPDDQEEEIADYVENKMLKEQKTFVVLKASKGIKAREVQRVAEAIGRTETAQQLHVAVLEKP